MDKILTTIPMDASKNTSTPLLRYFKRLVNNVIIVEEANFLTKDISFILLEKVKKDKKKRVVVSGHVSSID